MAPRRMLATFFGITLACVLLITVYSPDNVQILKNVVWLKVLPSLGNATYVQYDVSSTQTPISSNTITNSTTTPSTMTPSTETSSTTTSTTTSTTPSSTTTSITPSSTTTSTTSSSTTTSTTPSSTTASTTPSSTKTSTTPSSTTTSTTPSSTTTSTTPSSTTTSSTTSNNTITPSNSISTWTTTQMSIPPKKLFLTSRFIGRMGNQMFIYATLVGLARAQGREPFMSNGGDLGSLFQVSHIRKDINTNGWSVMGESKYATFDAKFMKLPPQNMIITGYLQCWRYFQHSQEEIRREYTFTSDVQKKVETALATYRNKRDNHVLVAVHIRRGDFLNPNNVKFGYGVPNASYFNNAFGKMRSLLTNQNVTFLLGSDDLDWCKNNLNDSSIEFLPQGSPADHFAILSSCDHAIITSGTFGWWIGWLANGVTIYYKYFITKDTPVQGGFTDPDYYPQGWIGLDN